MDEKNKEFAEDLYFAWSNEIVIGNKYDFVAEKLAKKGYRKESDTAREILTELLKVENLEYVYYTDKKGNIKDSKMIRIEKIKALAEKYGVYLGE